MRSIRFNEKKYLKRLERTLGFYELYKVDKKKVQKFKFNLISELVHALFKYKNCRDSFINISNLIILFLTVFEEDYPCDMDSGYEENDLIDENSEYKNILKEEFSNYL